MSDMNTQIHNQPSQSVAQWYVRRLELDMAPYTGVSLPGLPETSGLVWYRFYQGFLSDLFNHPEAYGIPEEPYEAYTEKRYHLSGDQEKEDRLRESRLKVRKAIEDGFLDFLYQIGRACEVDGQVLKLALPVYQQLIGEKIKRTKIKTFPKGLERLGMSFTEGEKLVISNERFPGLLAALSCFAKECATIKEHGFFFFRRCDYEVFRQKQVPALGDALRLIPEMMRADVGHTDALLESRKVKREIMVGDVGAGYRLRYNEKSDKIVYWCRVMSWFSPDLHHNLRWDFSGDLTNRLFSRLDNCEPGLADRIFDGFKKCAHCYENCMARVHLERKDTTLEYCKEAGWDTIGENPADFENLRIVLSLLDEQMSKMKK